MTKSMKRYLVNHKPKTVAYTIVYVNGATTYGQTDTFYSSAAAVRKMINDPARAKETADIRKIFLSDGNYLSEYLASEINDLSNWTEGT